MRLWRNPGPLMLRIKGGRMRGGLFFTATKAATIDAPIEPLAVRGTLRVPLTHPTGDVGRRVSAPDEPGSNVREEIELCVESGEHVEVGQLIARPRSPTTGGPRVFAPVSGRIGRRVTAQTALGRTVPAVEVILDRHPADGSPSPADAPTDRHAAVIERLESLGIRVGNGRPTDGPSSTGTSLCAGATRCADEPPAGSESASAAGRVRRIIIDGLESGPYATARTRTLIEHAEALVAAACELARALRITSVHLTVDQTLKTLVRMLRQATADTPITILPLSNRYPQCHPRLLYRAVTGRALPPVCHCSRAVPPEGTWMLSTCELWDVHHALTACQPPVTQTLTIAGDAVQRAGNYRVPLGTSVRAIFRRVGLSRPPERVVAGSALTGVTVRSGDAVIERGIEGLYAWTPAAVTPRDPVGCLHCGFCIEVCPAGIDPVSIFAGVETGRWKHIPALMPQACVDCGLCDYVCPAALPLMEAVSQAKTGVADRQTTACAASAPDGRA